MGDRVCYLPIQFHHTDKREAVRIRDFDSNYSPGLCKIATDATHVRYYIECRAVIVFSAEKAFLFVRCMLYVKFVEFRQKKE